jgi:bifunctional N-acetylglucosamine-1-phosphate-uridyltransferase/glucosamine-1-phosphate-acetyltransferase GlmU-like protein
MGLSYPKTLYPIRGKPILQHILEAAIPLVHEAVVIVSPQGKPLIEAFLSSRSLGQITTAIQETPVGMADAVEIGVRALGGTQPCDYLIIWGDQVTVRTETLRELKDQHLRSGAWLTLPTTRKRNPYIHIVRDADGNVVDVLEAREGDPMPEVGESDCGVFLCRGEYLLDGLVELERATYDPNSGVFRRLDQRSSATGEFNFLPLITLWSRSMRSVQALPLATELESLGVNTPSDVQTLESKL